MVVVLVIVYFVVRMSVKEADCTEVGLHVRELYIEYSSCSKLYSPSNLTEVPHWEFDAIDVICSRELFVEQGSARGAVIIHIRAKRSEYCPHES